MKGAARVHSQLNEIVLGICMMEMCDGELSSIGKGQFANYTCTLYGNGIPVQGIMRLLFNILDMVHDGV